jgi:MFS transporter, FSR family, fosmidomycin resistance protein
MFKLSWSRFYELGGWRRVLPVTAVLLLIEFFDELHYGIEGAVLPVLRTDLGLGYAQVGLLLGLPHLISTFVEPGLLLLGDTRLRKRLILGGGLMIWISLLLVANAQSFPVLLIAFIIAFPGSGAFVSLSQAALVDASQGREDQMMARWTAAGSIGNLVGPLLVAGGFALGLGWRWAFFGLAGLAAVLILAAAGLRFTARQVVREPHEGSELRYLLAGVWTAIRSPRLLRWIILAQVADLLMDIFFSYTPLYFTDVMGASPAQASLALAVLTAASLGADLLLIPLLERIPGRTIVRLTAAAGIVIFPLWMLAPNIWLKMALLVALRMVTMGWYPVISGEAFRAVPGRSGVVLAVSSLSGVLAGAMTWSIGWTAAQVGLEHAMWLLILAPISLALFVPRAEKD